MICFLLYRLCSFTYYALGAREHVRVAMTIVEHVKKLVLYRRDTYQGDVDPAKEPILETSSVKHLFGYFD